MNKQKILITSALPYANGPLHFGHIAGAYLPGDCFARFQRLIGNDVLYICGSDEYGVAITMSAEIAGRSPKEHVDHFHKINQDLFVKLNFSFDHFSRTTWEGHAAFVQGYFLDLLENGYIEKKETEQLFSEKDQKFLADRYVVGTCPKCRFCEARGDECPECGASFDATDLIHPKSKMTGAPLILKKTTHWFLLLDQFKEKLTKWLEEKEWKPNVINFLKSYVQELRPRSITRDSAWGVPVPLPGAEGKVLYVWFDAPIGYITATQEWAKLKGDKELWKSYWEDPKTKLIHFIGKDNIPFHGAIFPAMTMGQNLPLKLVDDLPANEFFKFEGKQFSKSDGWTIDLEDFFKHYTTDQIRYAIAANAPETSDSEFTWKDFGLRCNADLVGKLGNLVNRVLVFAHKTCSGKVPPSSLKEEDKEFLQKCQELTNEGMQAFSTYRLRKASSILMELAQSGNIYFDAKRPWQAAKAEETYPSMQTTIASCLECLKNLSLLAYPIMPEFSEKLWQLLGQKEALLSVGFETAKNVSLPVGQSLGKPEILFQKVEEEMIENEIYKLKNTLKEKKQKDFEPLKKEISYETFQDLDLRTGIILKASPIPKSKKLYQLEVDLGFEVREIVAGIRLSYELEELIGKKVVVVANLKPASIMGVQSHGMLLAAEGIKGLELVSFNQCLPGFPVS